MISRADLGTDSALAEPQRPTGSHEHHVGCPFAAVRIAQGMMIGCAVWKS
ncbi:hypothetical protein [Dactylosporangium sp. NPDC005555]